MSRMAQNIKLLAIVMLFLVLSVGMVHGALERSKLGVDLAGFVAGTDGNRYTSDMHADYASQVDLRFDSIEAQLKEIRLLVSEPRQ